MSINKIGGNDREIPEILKDNGEYIATVESNITLFSENNETGESKMFNKIYVFEKNGKFYSYNQDGKNVFLKGVHKDVTINNFGFEKINGEQVLAFEMSGTKLFFNQDGETINKKYIIEDLIVKVKTLFKVLLGGTNVLEEKKLDGKTVFEVK